MSKMETVDIDTTQAATLSRSKRKKAFAILGTVVATAATGYAAYSHFYLSRFVTTDNAYVGAETAQVTPATAGIVREVRVNDTQSVKAGDVLVALDDVDARLALDQSEAELGRAIRRVRGYVATDHSLAAQIEQRASDVSRAKIDLQRREALAKSGSVSGDELTKARNAYESAVANYWATIGSKDANAALIADASEETNPEVALARAKRDQAKVNLERTVIRAPIDGVIVKRSVQVGQQVQAG